MPSRTDDLPDALAFVVEGWIPSKKNSQRHRAGQHKRFAPKRIKDRLDSIEIQLRDQRNRRRIRAHPFGLDSVKVTIEVNPAGETATVLVEQVLPEPGYPNGRTRDLDGQLVTICDGLAAAEILRDDRQICWHDARRIIRGGIIG